MNARGSLNLCFSFFQNERRKFNTIFIRNTISSLVFVVSLTKKVILLRDNFRLLQSSTFITITFLWTKRILKIMEQHCDLFCSLNTKNVFKYISINFKRRKFLNK